MRGTLILILCLIWAAAGAPAQTQARKRPAASWDQIYLNPDSRVPVNPSSLVLETTANLKPGAVLDVGMGNGRNAIYLARKGWKVTGVDISEEAMRQARREAAKLKVELEYRAADVSRIDLGRERYDLILCLYVNVVATRNARKFMDALKPGGLLVVEGYHAAAQAMNLRQLDGPAGYYDNQLTRAFDHLRILRYEDRTMTAEWSNGPEGKAPIVRLVAQKP
jgi:SAM-dependent methyltransferase